MSTGKRGEKALHFGARLKYPIKITKLYKSPGDSIKRQEPVLQYSFEYTMELPQDRETLELQTKTLTSITDWDAPEDGKLLSWNVSVGDIIHKDRPAVTVEEACTHEIQFQGLCALCGKDMNEVNWASDQRDTDRAPINMTHDQTNLTVSREAAMRAENELQQRLLAQRKLSLVVDLDQTIIHACIDPTIGEWQNDPSNPNYDALKDVRRFQLDEGYHGLARGCWYYIKMRPGLADFLTTISAMYELHVYTMGTRTYATNIAHIVDPDQKLFGNRVISRDENGNIVAKSLQRLFPVSTHMAVIIDDRADVWPYNRHNLIKVTPYDFFKGTGDINSSFLPKRNDLPASASSAASSPADTVVASPATSATSETPSTSTTVVADDNKAATSPASTAAAAAIVTDASPSSSSESTNGESAPSNGAPIKASSATLSPDVDEAEAAFLQKQAEEQERTIEQQIKERPLLHMQEKLDKQDEEAAAAAAAAAPSDVEVDDTQGSAAARPQRHCVLFDDDTELKFLEEHLTKLHHAFYEEFEAKRNASTVQNGHLAAGGETTRAAVPDVGVLLDRLKSEVLQGTNIVLSGLVPLGVDVERSEIGLQALSFGANLQRQISKKVTHLVISSERPRTQKVRQAARIPTIKIVNQNWLVDSFSQWTHLDETPYLVDIHPADRDRSAAAGGSQAEGTDTETISDADSEDVNGKAGSGLKIVVTGAGGDDIDGKGDDEDEDDEFKEFKNSDAVSPIAELGQFDWGSADDELEMFLAEEGDDDDEDEDDEELEDTDYGENDDDRDRDEDMEDGNTGASLFSSASKRKHGTGGDDTDTEGERASLRGRSLLVKRQKLGASSSRSRSASRRRALAAAVAGSAGSASSSESSHPLKQSTNQDSVKTAPSSADIDDDELEAMLMAELDEEEAAEAQAAGGDGVEDGS